MRVTLTLLGWTFDWSLEPTAADEPTAETNSLDGGTTASTPVEPGKTDRWMGFTNGMEGDGE